jgi:hypothetical protein
VLRISWWWSTIFNGYFISISSDITTRGRHHISRRRSEALGNSEAWRLTWVETMQVRVWSRRLPGFADTRPPPFLAIQRAARTETFCV